MLMPFGGGFRVFLVYARVMCGPLQAMNTLTSLSLSLSFCFCAGNRYGGLSPSGPGVAEFGILHQHEGDCSVRDAPEGIWNNTVGKYDQIGKTTSRVGATIEIVFNKPVPYVGWYLKVMTRN